LVAAFFASARGRLITALTVVVLALGVVAEVISIMTGYYNMTKVRAEARALNFNPSRDLPDRDPSPGISPEAKKVMDAVKQELRDGRATSSQTSP